MSNAAKKALWREFLEQVDEEEEENINKQPVLKSSQHLQDPYNIAPSSGTLKLSAVLSSAMILILVGTQHYTMSYLEKSMNKLKILKDANENPMARVVTSE